MFITSSGMIGFENYLEKSDKYVLCKSHVATSKVKFTVRIYSLFIGFTETCSFPAHNFVVAPASDMVRYRDPVFHPFARHIKVLSYSRH